MLDKKEDEARWFTEARELFEAMVTWLSSDNVCGLEHGELENQLLVNGNELLRKLLQGYLDRRSDDEIEGDCQGSDGAKRTHKRKQSRFLTTIFGTVTVNRIGYGGRKLTSLNPLDGKGVVMRQEDLRPSTKKRAISGQRKLEKRLTKGEKRNSKRMATVAAVYTIKPFLRTALQIVNSQEFQKTQPPKPEGKRVWASLVKEPEIVISETFDEALHRDPHQQKNWVALVDGNKTQLRLLKQLAQKHKLHLTIVLDLIHVIEYLWKAAFVFHSPSSKQAEDWVSERLLRILEGKSSGVASGMRRSATLRQLTPNQRSAVDKCANYLLNNRDYLQYDDYLAAGFPIATGVIEGACRYLIKDRMDITGARWSLQGAEAVLRLRSLHVSGDWADYWQFHLRQEHQRNHRAGYQSDIPLLKSVTQARCSTPPPPTLIVM